MGDFQNLLLIFNLLALIHAAHLLKKVVVSDPDALCLDGTPAAYFIHEGDRRKILLYFEGGGWCGSFQGLDETIDTCFKRTSMFLGSSLYYPEIMAQSQGIFSDHPENIFKDWTLVHLRYCDGGGHQGYRKEPVDYMGRKLYFRGHNVTIGQLNSVDESHKLFTEATDIVVSGQSAGGLATFMWVNYIADRVSQQTKVWALPDSGIFLDSQNYTTRTNDYKNKFINLMTFTNSEVDPPNEECVRANPDEKWKCMFAEFMQQQIKVPLFVINSLYDSWSLSYLLNMECGYRGSLANCNDYKFEYIEEYRKNTSKIVERIGRKPNNGAWAPACSSHVYTMGSKFYSPKFRIPANSEISLAYAVKTWMAGSADNHFHMDSEGWPANKPCCGMNI